MRNGKRFLWIAGGFIALSSSFVAVASSVRQVYHHPKSPQLEIELINGQAVERETRGRAKTVTPQAVTDETEFDFGVMDPLTMGSHVFVIRNAGDAPLRLQAGPTSCKCTLSNVAQNEIPPGGSGEVRLEWNSGRKLPHFQQE